jgi:poly(3-hydroxybutyrate) depolymerase
MAVRRIARLALLSALLLAAAFVRAADSPTVEQAVTIAELFPPDEAAKLARTMRVDRRVNFRVRMPPGPAPHGVLVFVHPHPGGEPPEGWAEILDRRNLIWISPEGFGNDRAGAQRALVTLLALKHLARSAQLDFDRRYVGGMSGGGKIASQVLARFPAFFSGALCIVGADYVKPDASLKSEMAGKRVVFMTGDRDFNHYDVNEVYKRFLANGVTRSHLVDTRGFGHAYPDARQLDAALALLDPR